MFPNHPFFTFTLVFVIPDWSTKKINPYISKKDFLVHDDLRNMCTDNGRQFEELSLDHLLFLYGCTSIWKHNMNYKHFYLEWIICYSCVKGLHFDIMPLPNLSVLAQTIMNFWLLLITAFSSPVFSMK